MGGSSENVPEIYRGIGERIRHYRDRAGLSQMDLANLMDPVVEKSSISMIENARQTVRVHQLVQIADALDVHILDLLPDVPRPDGEELQAANTRLRASIIGALKELQKGV